MTYKIKELALASLCVTALVACSSGDLTEGTGNASSSNKQVEVTLNIGVQEPEETTRTWDGSQSDNGTGENMYSWFVIVAQNGTVVDIVESGSITDLEKDEVTLNTALTEGASYDFYSFANIERSSISALSSLTAGSTLPTMTDITYTVNGNGFDISNNHIPMSNYQSKEISSSGEVDLWVVRMLAKITLKFTNSTGSEVKINSATLSEITANESNNLMLLPDPTGYSDTGACTPNLNGTPSTVDYTYEPSDALTIANGATDSLTFYVNESATPTMNAHGLFTLTLNCGDGTTYYRYALITITNDDDNWNYIARNDYRVIPITLQEYSLALEVYDWPPIAVLPASVMNENGLFTATFHAAGHFHIVPVVTKYGDATALSYGTSTDEWELSSWDVGTEGTDYPTDFYETDASSTTDECENGGVPKWDETNHFIFGYMKDTGVTSASNPVTKAYHDLTINVNRSGSPATRQLTYHLCIVKDLAY